MPLDSGTKDDIEDHLANGIPALEAERVAAAHSYASGYGQSGAACQAALDEHGAIPSVVHLDVEVSALGSAAPLEVPSNTVVSVEADITLADDTAENIIQSKDAFTQDVGTGGSTIRENVHIVGAGGTLDGNKANQTAGPDGFNQCGVNLYADQSSVRDLRVRDATHHNISVVGGTLDVAVIECDLRDPGFSNIQGHYRSTGGDDGDGALVQGARIIGNTCVGGDNTGSIRMAGVQNMRISENYVRDHTTTNDNHGIRVYQGDYPADNPGNINIINNILENVKGDGIRFDSSTEDDTVGGFGDFSITANQVREAGGAGIRLLGSTSLIAHGVVESDVHNGDADGIWLSNAIGVRVASVITSNSGTAIVADNGSDENLYDGNVARGNGTDSLSGAGTNSVVGDNVGL
jgi:hypothetical protein